jgi:hypothetical protein
VSSTAAEACVSTLDANTASSKTNGH